MALKINTRVNEVLGSRYPLIVGTMLGWSNAELVAAAANAGAFGCIASSMYDTADALRDEIRKARSLTDGPFGVNINLFPAIKPKNVLEYVDIVLGEGVKVIETAGRSPEELVERVKSGNGKLMHKCARLRDARKAESLGADLVEIVGMECGGHPSREGIGGLVLVPQVVDALQIPVVAGGGIADGRGFVAALALGAEGVLMGTRFLATDECQIHSKMKDRLVEAESTESVLVLGSLGDPLRALRTALSDRVQEMEARNAPLEELLPIVAGVKSREALLAGDIDNSLMACGQVVGMVREVLSVKEVVARVVEEAAAIYEKLGGVLK